MANEKPKLKDIIEMAAERGAQKAISRLKENGRISYYFSDSFTKTEALLELYPFLDEDNEMRAKVDHALLRIKDHEYKDVIVEKYWNGLTFEQISEIYGCKPQNISKQRANLIRILAKELFPEDVLKEILHG